jgi:hypothetical protein
MSRAYRIRVRESLKRVVRGRDNVSTQLEVLEVLPREQMGALLREELLGRGFKEKGELLVRNEKGVTVTVDPQTGKVTVQSDVSEAVEVDGERETRSYTDTGPGANKVRELLREEVRKDLEQRIEKEEGRLQSKATDQLEARLGDLRKELDQAVNRVTAEALKQKAATMGQIKEITEDPQSGSMTIVLEV